MQWNHFRREEILELFGGYFKIEWNKHFSALESERITRYFYEVQKEKPNRQKSRLLWALTQS
jgi:hypothetical protein